MKHLRLFVLIAALLGLASPADAYQYGGTVTGPASMTTPAGNTIDVPAGETVEFEVIQQNPPPGEVIEVVGDGTTIGLNAPGSESDVDGDNTTTNHNASPTDSHTDGNNNSTSTSGAATSSSSATAHGTVSTTTSQP